MAGIIDFFRMKLVLLTSLLIFSCQSLNNDMALLFSKRTKSNEHYNLFRQYSSNFDFDGTEYLYISNKKLEDSIMKTIKNRYLNYCIYFHPRDTQYLVLANTDQVLDKLIFKYDSEKYKMIDSFDFERKSVVITEDRVFKKIPMRKIDQFCNEVKNILAGP